MSLSNEGHEAGVELQALPVSLRDRMAATAPSQFNQSAEDVSAPTSHQLTTYSSLPNMESAMQTAQNHTVDGQASEPASAQDTSRLSAQTTSPPTTTASNVSPSRRRLQSMYRSLATRGRHPDPCCDTACCCCDRCSCPTLVFALIASSIASGGFWWAWQQDRLEKGQVGYKGGLYAPGYEPGDVYEHGRPVVRSEGESGSEGGGEVGDVIVEEPTWEDMIVTIAPAQITNTEGRVQRRRRRVRAGATDGGSEQ